MISLLLAAGCGPALWYEWRDEPYVRPVYRRGASYCLRLLESRFASRREIAARALSVIARERRRAGDDEGARRLARRLMEFYRRQEDERTRAAVAALCLKNCGPDPALEAFLKERIKRRETPTSAAMTLAAWRTPGAFEVISSLLADDHETRYEALMALWLLGDARGVRAFEKALSEIDSWPERIHHMPKAVYRKNLEERLLTLKASTG